MAIQYSALDFLNKLYANDFSYTNSYKKRVNESNAEVENLQEDITKMKKTVKGLAKYSEGVTPKTKVKKQIESLVKAYNKYSKDAAKVSDDEIEEQMEKLEKLFSENEKDLKKIGLKKSDKKLEFDSEIFEDADKKTIKKLFEGRTSFAKQADKIIRKIEESANNSQYRVEERNFSSTMRYNPYDVELAYSLTATKETLRTLNAMSELMENGVSLEEYKDELKDVLGLFVSFAYNSVDMYDNEYYDKIQAICEEHESDLSKIGITIEDTDGKKTMKYDSDLTNFNKEAFIGLFGKDAAFADSIISHCENGFHQTLKPEIVGVSIVDTYA